MCCVGGLAVWDVCAWYQNQTPSTHHSKYQHTIKQTDKRGTNVYVHIYLKKSLVMARPMAQAPSTRAQAIRPLMRWAARGRKGLFTCFGG